MSIDNIINDHIKLLSLYFTKKKSINQLIALLSILKFWWDVNEIITLRFVINILWWCTYINQYVVHTIPRSKLFLCYLLCYFLFVIHNRERKDTWFCGFYWKKLNESKLGSTFYLLSSQNYYLTLVQLSPMSDNFTYYLLHKPNLA